jgi:ferrous iron transport protein B
MSQSTIYHRPSDTGRSLSTIALVGNPNCGKTTLFNALTGSNQRVGNWPGVTVERKEGQYRFHNQSITVVDLPGVYSLDVEDASTGLDEQVAQQYLLSGEARLIINIVDASNLERNLYLTTQLLEMGIPMAIALNMMDLAKKDDVAIDVEQLEQRLGCPVIPISAHIGQGVAQLKETIGRAIAHPSIPHARVAYAPVIETALSEIAEDLEQQQQASSLHHRWNSLALLQYDDSQTQVSPDLSHKIATHRHRIHQTLGDDIDLMIADARYTWINQMLQGVMRRSREVQQRVSDRIDRVVLSRGFGIPIFLVMMYLVFLFSINFGGAFIDFFDISFGTIFVDGIAHGLTQISAPGWMIGLLADGVGGGIQTTATFIPQIGLLFICLAILEDSGYLARAAFVMDRVMRFIGLPGKAFVPMMVGFGCNIPGIMAARTLENRHDRLMTVLMNPFMSCGARLPVYALFCAAFFPYNGQNIVFLLYAMGILAAVFTGLVMKHTLLKGQSAPFVMELPPYHIPTVKGVLIRAWERLRAFITRAGKMIVIMVVILGLLSSVGTDGSFGKHDSQDSLLSSVSRTITPVFAPMGIESDNWPATVGIFTGVFAKEVMVGSMDALYTELANQEADAADQPLEEEDGGYSFWGGMGEAVASIPANLADLTNQVLDPIGMGIMGSTTDQETAATEQAVHFTTFGQMAQRFGSPAAAIAFLLFVLLYFPCVAATAAVFRETNLGWTIFVGAWTTGLGYWVATFYYQSATFSQNPGQSAACLVGLVAVMGTVLAGMKIVGDRRRLHRSQ